MAQIRRTRSLAAQPQAAWDVLADFGSISSWAANVDHSCMLDHERPAPDSATGEQIGASRRIQVGRNAVVERITEFDPPHTLGYDIEGLPRRLRRVHARWALTPEDSRTRVTLTSTVDIGSNPIQRLAEYAVCRLMAKQSDALLAGLARRLESSGG